MIKAFLKKLRRRLLRKPYLRDPRFPAYWFARVLGGHPAQIVQIGSNDGKTGDPLYPLFQRYPAWRGLLVEPLPATFARLQENYPDRERFQLANVAINDGTALPFYYVDPRAKTDLPDLPYWYEQLGSFYRGHIEKELDGVLTPYVRTTTVEGITLADLLARHNIAGIDLLHIDTEGYDWKILGQLDLSRYAPTFILYEAQHLAAEELAAAAAFLAPQYRVFQTSIDHLAVHRKLGEKLLGEMAARMPAVE
ncbi:FkbM family methyltransferase [Neolewinella lacunae]|uniref:FkbM family methyltransferase n=1 Tax=Neolewinella lacunae TaxID=1517758 RepID=A0A923PMQ6_9BACT|nr:FkbM family methyltransferase [Neolewinella lacunae]MBC6994129.1 FkbM family methyltransferase [Neolewinella lacunae]MDN3636722.1 FkbM family methyltransferase [Neolewinella lacunae]